MSAVSQPSVVACRWCGLPVGGGPACDVCGSPVVDVTGWSTVLDVTWPIEEALAHVEPPLSPAHHWLTLPQAAARTGVPESVLRLWLEHEGVDPSGDAGRARFLLVDPASASPKMMLAAAASMTPTARPAEAIQPPPAPLPPPLAEAPSPPRVDLPWLAAPTPIPRWSAPVRVRISLDGDWVFQPSAQARRSFRIERIRSISATSVGVAAAAKGVEFLVQHALR
jgi:hypothetical protein